MTTEKTKVPGCLTFIAVIVGIFLLYYMLFAFGKVCIYLGYNFSFYLDNLLQLQGVNPIIAWAIPGLLMGSIAGVIIAAKKYKLSKILVLYPIGLLAVFVTVMILVNHPGQYSGSLSLPNNTLTNTVDVQPKTIKYYYIAIKDVNTRKSPSVSGQKAFVLKKGEEVEIIQRRFYDARKVEWLKIKYNSKEAYVSSEYLKFSRTGD